MKYNKLEIMRNANKYAKSIGRRAALRKAWAEAKIGRIGEQLFFIRNERPLGKGRLYIYRKTAL